MVISMNDTIVKDVILASDFKYFILSNITEIEMDLELKNDVLKYADNTLLEVTKGIGSLRIIDVKAIDDELVNDVLGTSR